MSKIDKKEKKEKKSKRAPEEEEEVGTGDLPETDTGAEERAEARKKRKKKQKVVEEEEEEPPVESDQEAEDGENGEDPVAAANRLMLRRKKKKLTGYRSKANECGFVKNAGIAGSGGEDIFAATITTADAKRLMRFVPEVLNKSSYDKAECAARMALSTESVPESAARVTQTQCEAVMRKFVKDAVLLTLEKGVGNVTADTMQSVLRSYQYNMAFSSVLPPKGLIRHAQANAVLSASAADAENADKEKEENRELSAAQRKIDASTAARKAAYKARRNELAKQREAQMAAA